MEVETNVEKQTGNKAFEGNGNINGSTTYVKQPVKFGENATRIPRSEKKRRKRLEKIVNMKEMRKEKRLVKKLKRENISVSSSCKVAENNEIEVAQKTPVDKIDTENKDNILTKPGLNMEHVPKKQRLELIRQRCKEAMATGVRICVDCSLERHMSSKEYSKLAQQIARLYGSNRKSSSPVHIILTGLKRESEIYTECVRKNSGFENYLLDVESASFEDVFSSEKEKIVYLTPDSDKVLEQIETDRIYIIGGLIDETIKNNITAKIAEEKHISTARLPIDEHMVKVGQGSEYSYNKILAVNQVFDILLVLNETGSWEQALRTGVPKRKGYVVKD